MGLLPPPSYRGSPRATNAVAPLMDARVCRTKYRISQLRIYVDIVFRQLLSSVRFVFKRASGFGAD